VPLLANEDSVHCVRAHAKSDAASGNSRSWIGTEQLKVGCARLGMYPREMYHKRWPFGSEKRRCRRKTCRGRYTITYSVSKVLAGAMGSAVLVAVKMGLVRRGSLEHRDSGRDIGDRFVPELPQPRKPKPATQGRPRTSQPRCWW